jgi:N-acetylglucosaminyldiphosphoundecaprenol N-acetyl-beta-D-mannosaminyltransferase
MKIFQLEIPKLRYSDFFKEITKYVRNTDERNMRIVCTPNPEICLKTLEDKEFLTLLQKADYLTNDGIGLYLAYQIMESSYGRLGTLFLFPKYIFKIMFFKVALYERYGDRICGSDVTSDLLYFCEKKNIEIAILDPYYPEDREKCEAQKNFSKNLKKHFPKLQFQMYVYSEEKKEKILKKIAKSRAQILFSTLGMKRQEQSLFEAKKVCPNLRLGL